MTVSLLYSNESARESAGSIGKDTLCQLSLDRVSEGLGLPRHTTDYFMQVLSAPLTDQEAILYRREILQCFLNQPALLSELSDLYDQFGEAKADYANIRKEKRYLLRSASAETMSGCAKNLLQSAALMLKRCLLFIETLTNILRKYPLNAQGLQALLVQSQNITAADAFRKLLQLCDEFEVYSQTGGTCYRMQLNPLGRICAYDLIDRRYVQFEEPEQKKKRFIFSKKESADSADRIPCAKIDLTFSNLQNEIKASPIITLSDLLDAIVEHLFRVFLEVGRELDFYKAATCCCSLIAEKGAPLCFAEIRRDLVRNCTDLYDLFLLQAFSSCSEITPNDLTASSGMGCAVFGENGSGKTVWLRSIGCLHIFTQAGLPVPAKSAEVGLYRKIFSHFSSAEKEFEAGNEAGRFEQEVREMAAIMDEISESCLILLNETFQTTAYEEGAEGLSWILRYWAENGNQWILATHLKQLMDRFEEGEISLYQTNEQHKVSPVDRNAISALRIN